jgi:hypothetical protein
MSIILAVGAETQAGQFGNLTSSDYIYIRATEPFWAVVFEMLVPNVGAALPFQTAEYSAGSGSWTSITAKDSTMALSRNGCIALLPTTDIYDGGLWVEDTVDSVSGYWIRFAPDNTMTSTQVADVFVVPYRPGLDPNRFVYTAQALAGTLPQILQGTWRGENIAWQHIWTLEAAEVMQFRTSRVRGGSNMGRLNLWAWCQDDVYQMAIGPEAHPARAAWPPTNANTHVIWASGWDFGEVAQVNAVHVKTEFLQADDELWLYWRWDNRAGWHNDGPFSTGPVLKGRLAGQGRVLHMAVALNDATRDAVAPQIISAEIPSEAEGGWSPLGASAQPKEEEIASPQAR